MTVNPIIFNEMGESDAGWKTVYNKDSSEGVQRNDVLPEKEHEGIKLRPRPVTKPTKKPILENQMPGNIGRPERELTQFTVRDRPERAPVLFEPSSPSTKEYFYAPNDLTGRRVAGFQESGDQLNLPHEWPDESATNYGDSDLNLEVGSDGYHNMEQDSNFSRKPKTWRFRTRDNDLGLQQVRQESLPDLRDVGVSEMIYPLQSGLRPIVFGATPGQRKHKKKMNRKRSERRKAAEEKPKAEPVAPPPAPQAAPDVFEEPEGFVEKTPTRTEMNRGLKELDEHREAEREFYQGDQRENAKEVEALEESLPPEQKKELDALSDEEKKSQLRILWKRSRDSGLIKKGVAPGSSSGYRGNIMEDPALAALDPAMLDQEKVFTTIRKWEGDSYVIGADKLDPGTQEILAEKPEGEGHYFRWNYVTPAESEKMSDEEIKKEGFTISQGQGVLSVERLGGWKEIETEVMNKRRARPA